MSSEKIYVIKYDKFEGFVNVDIPQFNFYYKLRIYFSEILICGFQLKRKIFIQRFIFDMSSNNDNLSVK